MWGEGRFKQSPGKGRAREIGSRLFYQSMAGAPAIPIYMATLPAGRAGPPQPAASSHGSRCLLAGTVNAASSVCSVIRDAIRRASPPICLAMM